MSERGTFKRDGMEPSLPLKNKIDRWIKLRLINLAERIFSRKILSPDILDRMVPSRILIIRSHDQLGDFLLSTPAFDAIRSRFPRARIGILVKKYFADAVKMHPALDEILVIEPKISRWKFDEMAKFIHALFHRWDMAVILSSESHSLTSDILSLLSGAKIILGSTGFVFPGCSRNFLYNLNAPDGGLLRHQTERNLAIIEYIGATAKELCEKVHISLSEKETLAVELNPRLPKPGKPIIGLHIGANKLPNRWPVQKFAKLANQIHDRQDANVLLFWGPGETHLSEQFMRHVSFKPVRIPPSSLRWLAVYFSLCSAALCNDTGIMHLCAAVGTPLVALFGPADPVYWKPIGEKIVAIRGKEKRTDTIGVNIVYQELEKQLRKWPRSPY